MPVATDQFAAAWETFFRTTRRVRARGAKELIAGLTLSQYQLLEALAGDEPELSVGTLAEAAGVAPPTATRMLDCLARDGHVERRHSEADRRAVLVSLTPAGRVAVQEAKKQVNAFRRRVFEALEPEERDQVTHLLTRLSEVLEEQMP